MLEICADTNLIAYCGLYCGSCKKYLKEKCPGCMENEKASWCNVRLCCSEHSFKSCADCTLFDNVNDCKKLNNFISKIFALVFRSDRAACLETIKAQGYDAYATEMADKKIISLSK